MIRVLVVDDHRTFTDLVSMALDAQPDLECVGAARDAAGARALVDDLLPDVVLMDVNLGATGGLELTSELLARHPDLRVVVLTAHGSPAVIRRAVAVGACAVLPKDGSLPELLSTLRSAGPGSVQVHPSLMQGLVGGPGDEEEKPLGVSLTPRESHVLHLLAQGYDVRAIAKELRISVSTCRGYVKSLLMKLDAHSQLEAVVIAGMHGLLDSPPGEDPGRW